jgi:hypothetical protein
VRGIFRSVDAGQTWVRINDDQHQWGRAGDTAITGDPRIFGRVYIGTNGRAFSTATDNKSFARGSGSVPPAVARRRLTTNLKQETSLRDKKTFETNFREGRRRRSSRLRG